MTQNGVFASTHWSVVLTAGEGQSPQASEALEKLCQAYWQPLYVYARRRGYSPEDAQDLTQQFFALFLRKRSFSLADPSRGRFRVFLLKSLQHFLADDWKRAHRIKRGGGAPEVSMDSYHAEDRIAIELADTKTPEGAYEQRWAVTLIEQVLTALRQEFNAADKARLFEELSGFIWGDKSTASYAEIAGHLNLTEGTVKVAVHRLRQRFRELLRAEVAHTVARPEDIDGELRHLISVAG